MSRERAGGLWGVATPQREPGPLLFVFGLLGGLLSVVVGVALIRDVESAFGAVWASGFVIIGLIVLSSALVVATRHRASPRSSSVRQEEWDGEPAQFRPRRAGFATVNAFATLALLAGWFTAIGVVGLVEENWLWPVLTVVPAGYFLGFVVLGALGRFRPGGVWVTGSRIVDEHYGLRSEIALADVVEVSQHIEEVILLPRDAAAVHRRRLTPAPWRARQHGDRLAIRAADLDGGPEALALSIREHRDGVHRR